jgi:hypothetical protein
MKSFLRIMGAFALTVSMFTVSAQSPKSNNAGWPVSKGVQYYSNKSLATFKPMKIKSVGTPSFVQSKRGHARGKEIAAGNIRATGTPNWVISKPVNLISR